MEEEQMSSVPCSSLAVESAIRVATAGGIFGFCAGPREGRRIGLTGVPQASYVAKYVGRFGFQCGLVGAVAGGAVAVRTRNLTQVVGTAGLVSAFSVLANYSRTN
ncbi:PREDICTED: outer envelope pore protein 16-4, chloroplastic isoform X2 [Tarenaya hassleriana]|uniref:outer envelope pore protein 16-4, chloroplastic isoform X2 n=1 Tax=Tarenaya hassleriana TaxID=28532 RepID=UPI00053C9635|nr:PREDICTED: outer envelope pore protein 16-4, chloroplastic isoform X2 [Tarenaya hassleriana]